MISGSDAKRILRMVESQPDDLFYADVMAAGDVIRHPETFNDWCRGILQKGSKEQQAANYGPRVEGHHPVSVSSTQAAGQHLSMADHGKFIDGLEADGIPVGTVGKQMVPLSKNAHTGNAPIAAHVDPTTGNLDEGVWQIAFDGTKYGNDLEALSDAFINQSANPQIMLAEAASMQPGELLFQEEVARQAGVRPQALMVSGGANASQAADIKKQLAKDKFPTLEVASDIYGDAPAQRGGKKSSNSVLLTAERPDANIVRRNAGLGGNEEFAQNLLGDYVMKLRANNPRRRL